MGLSVRETLAPQRIIGVFQQLRLGPTTFSDIFRWTMAQGNVLPYGGREFQYDVFDITRKVATGRLPGDTSATVEPQKVGNVRGEFPRSAEKVPLLDEKIMNLRRIGGPGSELDARGETYITRQEQYIAQRFANIIEFQTAAMCRGTYVHVRSGDDLFQDFTGTGTTVNFQIPAGNKDQLDMLGAGDIIGATWATISNPIVGDLFAINTAFQSLTGMPLAHVICGPEVWLYVLNNTEVKNHGGSANVVFERFNIDEKGNFTGVIRSLPWLQFHIVSHKLAVGSSATDTLLIEADHAVFMPQPDPSWVTFGVGSEMVTEGPNGPRSEQFGIYPYAYPTNDPSGWSLNSIFNGIPFLYVPKAIAYGDVTP